MLDQSTAEVRDRLGRRRQWLPYMLYPLGIVYAQLSVITFVGTFITPKFKKIAADFDLPEALGRTGALSRHQAAALSAALETLVARGHDRLPLGRDKPVPVSPECRGLVPGLRVTASIKAAGPALVIVVLLGLLGLAATVSGHDVDADAGGLSRGTGSCPGPLARPGRRRTGRLRSSAGQVGPCIGIRIAGWREP